MQSVLLKIPMSANTGYGNDGFALIRACHEMGFDVRLKPTFVVPPIPMGCAQMLVKSLDVNFDYIIHHVDPISLGLDSGEKNYQGKKIAWTMWEFMTLSPEIAETMTERLDGYDLLLVYDEVSYAAMEPHANEANVPIRILQGGVWVDDWAKGFDPKTRDWFGTFRFGMVGQLHQRKNPFAAITAFKNLKADPEFADTDVELHLKTTVMGLHPAIEKIAPGVKIHYDIWSEEQLKKFYAGLHCYVAPSWGEGKNLPALESQIMGVPVIYSNFGGHKQWGSSEYGWPIEGELESHVPQLPEMLSMRVDIDALTEAMKEAVRDRANTRRKGEIAARTIPSQTDWKNVMQRFFATV